MIAAAEGIVPSAAATVIAEVIAEVTVVAEVATGIAVAAEVTATVGVTVEAVVVATALVATVRSEPTALSAPTAPSVPIALSERIGPSERTDQNERIKLYRQADAILVREAAIVPVMHSPTACLIQPWVERLFISPLSTMSLWTSLRDVVICPH